MKKAEANAIICALTAWAAGRDDVRAFALLGSWARGNPRPASDIDLLLLSEQAREYRRRRRWLTEIDFGAAGYRLQSSRWVAYGTVWSQHLRLIPTAEVELTIAKPVWARTAPIDCGTRSIVKDAFRILLDKDGSLARLVAAVMSSSP